MQVNELKRLKELEKENERLKRLVADQALDIVMLKDINSKNWRGLLCGLGEARSQTGCCRSPAGRLRSRRNPSLRAGPNQLKQLPLQVDTCG